MPVPIQGDVYPQPRDRGDVVAAWRVLSSRLLAESAQAESALARARRGGSDVAGQSAGLVGEANEIVVALSAAKPGPDVNKLSSALANSDGVTAKILAAKAKANDPDTYPGVIDFDRAIATSLNEQRLIEADARELNQWGEPPGTGRPGPV
jgi:hypothetical protein